MRPSTATPQISNGRAIDDTRYIISAPIAAGPCSGMHAVMCLGFYIVQLKTPANFYLGRKKMVQQSKLVKNLKVSLGADNIFAVSPIEIFQYF